MLDIGWAELLTVGVVALLVVGPKELPALARTIGRYMRVVRRHASEFRAQFDEAIKDTEFEEIKKDFQDLKSTAQQAKSDVASAGRLSDADWDGPKKSPHTPNYSEDELDWLHGKDAPSAAAAAAAAAATVSTQARADAAPSANGASGEGAVAESSQATQGQSSPANANGRADADGPTETSDTGTGDETQRAVAS